MWCMILTMTTVGYGEIYPVTIFGRIFTIIACIWGMFNMSMIIVTLTGIVKLTPEQEQSFNEICNQDPETVRKIKNEATVVIQSAWRCYLAHGIPNNPKFAKADSKMIIKTRLEFTAIAKRYKYKRLNVENANPQLGVIINDLKVKVNNFLETGMKNLNTYRTEVTKQVGQMRVNQYHMDSKMLKLYDVTMKLNSFIVACNRGEVIEAKDFNKNKSLYTHRRTKMATNHVKEFLALFKDARTPVDSFYEGFRPVEKPISKLVRSSENVDGGHENLAPSLPRYSEGEKEENQSGTYEQGEEEGYEEDYEEEGYEEEGEEEGAEEEKTVTENNQTQKVRKTSSGKKDKAVSIESSLNKQATLKSNKSKQGKILQPNLNKAPIGNQAALAEGKDTSSRLAALPSEKKTK